MSLQANNPLSDAWVLERATAILEHRSKRRGLMRFLPFLGPAFIAAVAYVDPGNFATNIQGGAQFGYMLLWVVLGANLMAMLVQTLSAKLGIATGKNLPENMREHLSQPWMRIAYWLQAEVVAMSTDLAEFLGAALAFQLLLGIPLVWGAVLTAIISFSLLGLQRYGFRPLEAAIGAFIVVIGACYVLEVIYAKPFGAPLLHGIFVPTFKGTESVLLAAGILGATVMPHVIYLHSSLTQHRIRLPDGESRRRLLRYNIVDVVIAMGLAGFVNMAMLAMAAATFHNTGRSHVASIETAYQTLTPLLGAAAATAFAVSLLASGLSSSAVGTLAGQVIMQGFVNFSIPLWLRRSITMLPAFAVIMLGLEPTRALVLSQVVLSFGIPFALVPLLLYTSNSRIMGSLVNSSFVKALGWSVAALIIALNLFLLFQVITNGL